MWHDSRRRSSDRGWSAGACVAALLAVTSCSSPTQPQYPQQYAAGYGYQSAYGAPLRLGPYAMSAAPTKAGDPINTVDVPWLRSQTTSDYRELSNALEPAQKQRTDGIPLLFDDTPGEVNAFAACTSGGMAVMAVTDGLLEVSANLAQAQATDERFGTRKTDEYIKWVADNNRITPPESFWNPTQKNDPQKVQRQHEIFDEEVGLVVGHEMAHHYLGHLPCSAGNVTAAEANVVLRSAAPGFNQINEVGADNGGTRNVLAAGARRNGYKWTEGGGLLVMRFFAGLSQLRPSDVVFSFQRTHPPAQLRIPIIQQSANAWRMSGGSSPSSGLPLPIPLQLPF